MGDQDYTDQHSNPPWSPEAKMTGDVAYKTPITDLLADIPEDARQMYEHHSTHHQNIPFGRLAKEALDEIERARTCEREGWRYADELTQEADFLRRENERLREALELIATGELNYPEQVARLALKGETE